MADINFYLSAGLPVAKDSGQSPVSQENTVYITSGLPPIVITSAGNIKSISGVAWADILKVSSVAKASIKTVSGVSST